MQKLREIKLDIEKKQQINEVDINWNIHANLIHKIALMIEPKFIFTKENKIIYKLFLQYFTGNINFENEMLNYSGKKGDFKKGILLNGTVGVGKDLIFKVFKYYTKHILRTNSFLNETAISIIDNVNIEGVEFLTQFSYNKSRPRRIYIEDIASKNEIVNNFGTKINVIEQLLSLRYNVYERYGTLTHASTNKYMKEILTLYDDRIVSRMASMFNIIEMQGVDYRKK